MLCKYNQKKWDRKTSTPFLTIFNNVLVDDYLRDLAFCLYEVDAWSQLGLHNLGAKDSLAIHNPS